jgi:hypothetical protein
MKKTPSLLLLLIFIAYYSSTGLFLHTHIVQGVAVVHSHFYLISGGADNPPSSSAPSQHQHTTSEFTLINILSFWNSEQAFAQPDIPAIDPPVITVINTDRNDHCHNPEIPSLFLRGPPVA